ncbi:MULTISPECIES: PTS sugar transporter subunit IIB [Bacillus]|uniref:PTS sugar transporter subunit IIB n=1 Tax=Bacillus pseudomycoides TaxID=64104 RepID=A0A1Y3MAC3_9BACI|nr:MULTISPECIES: PTS sugar transporter subunit IIB [Bacillus cereus group]EOP61294.1 PTS system, diacetylchitobiose-specific IIB component [Bacillus cereus VD136]EOP76501.1 PTS system, diacetylchitobiose-specific IIB component [Bacillus cereus VDM006]EOQ17014.1 PTS system, diacetylchitobiose-specific IIB component [Bacillus cereus VDM021]OOG91011.1 PTS system, diacetylchitobiose-specific IIB component [Bacillus mycoides]PEY42347.1 PTS sugar transporter subunit IIB [Bacillus cereus]
MKVLFVCSGGMSSAIVVNALKKEGEKHGQNLEVLAVGTQEFDSEVRNGWDVAMVAPQVKHRFDGFKASADEAGVPCLMIPAQSYSPLGGPALLNLINEIRQSN